MTLSATTLARRKDTMETLTRTADATFTKILEFIDEINSRPENACGFAQRVYETDGGRKYVRVTMRYIRDDGQHEGGSVHMFIGMAEGIYGDIYKPASYKAPALNVARYNLFDDWDQILEVWDWAGGWLYKR